MIKKTVAVISVAALAAGAVALPAAAASDTPIQVAGCAAKCGAKKCGACGAAKCGAKKCGACGASMSKCGAKKCGAKKCGAQ